MKRTMYEGGDRSPTIVRWPGVIAPGSTNDVPHTLSDVGFTLVQIGGGKALPSTGLRGVAGGAVSLLDMWKKGLVSLLYFKSCQKGFVIYNTACT